MKIAVIGDCFLDRYWIGRIRGMSPEAPVPVVDVKETVDLPGGAANVARNLEGLGVEVVKIYNSLAAPVKNRLMVNDLQLARWDERDVCVEISTISLANPLNVDGIVVSDYGKGSITPEVRDWLMGQKVPVFVDTKQNPGLYVDIATAVFPNRKEYQQYKDEYDQFDLCVLKEGRLGMSLLSRGERWVTVPALASKVVSVVGAGDTVIAAFVYKFISNGCLQSMANRALMFANAAAACVVEKKFTSTVTLEEVEKRLK